MDLLRSRVRIGNAPWYVFVASQESISHVMKAQIRVFADHMTDYNYRVIHVMINHKIQFFGHMNMLQGVQN